jgi:alginate O-acetyltransferase complex protein AlgI
MLFNSYEFVFFFVPIVLLGFFFIATRSHRLAALWLAAASLFFYGWWNPKFVTLLLASVAFNYAMAQAIEKGRGSRNAKILLAAAVAANLAVLGVFKYSNFFISTVNAVAGTEFGLTSIILPLGVSFFTFTQIAFLIDVHRNIAHEFDFIRYLLFVTYFPHLIAGPVLHHRQMMPQFARTEIYRINPSDLAVGIAIFTIGLAKKVLLADSFAEYANPVFDAAREGPYVRFFVAWTGALAYTLQLYFDFSGYSDMAIGVSRMFGIVLPLNFNAPYKAPNIIEFWRRWHMTLSQFLRDYLYFPLGGNRHGKARRYTNLMVTMLLGGLWHGANWTFVAWGGLHGLFLVVNHLWQAVRRRLGWDQRPSTRTTRVLGVGLTFLCVVFAWVFFRAESFHAGLQIIKGMVGWNGFNLPESWAPLWSGRGSYFKFEGAFGDNEVLALQGVTRWLAYLALGLCIIWAFPTTQRLFQIDGAASHAEVATHSVLPQAARSTFSFPVSLSISLLFAISLFFFSKASPFLYFQF